jgi:hypothetical protein
MNKGSTTSSFDQDPSSPAMVLTRSEQLHNMNLLFRFMSDRLILPPPPTTTQSHSSGGNSKQRATTKTTTTAAANQGQGERGFLFSDQEEEEVTDRNADVLMGF